MTVYFDPANLETLLLSKEQAGFAETIKMLRSEVGVALNCTPQEAYANVLLRPFVMQMTSGQKNTPKIKFPVPAYPDRPISPTFYSLPHAHQRSVVFATGDELSACKAAGTFLVGQVGEELEALGRLHRGVTGKYVELLTVGRGKGEFASWNQLTPYVLPFHDLILHDRYLLRQSWACRHNYPQLLEALMKGRKGKVNVVLLTLAPEKDNTDPVGYEELRRLTHEVVTAATGEAPSFTLVLGETLDDVGHDRHIFTNYQWFDSRDSLTYFKSNDDLKSKSDTLTIHSLADNDIRKHVDKILQRIQQRIRVVDAEAPHLIEGDRVSSFLTF